MTSPNHDPRPPLRARLIPAIGLFLLAPLVGEFLLGNLPISAFGSMLLLAPLYGGGALLIRETIRRWKHGWPSMIAMCVAYGIFEEAFITQSLFNPDYLGYRLLDYGFIPQLGISAWWTVYVVGIHVIWSTAVPIALVEACTPRTRHTPWLGWLGLTITALVFVLGSGILFISQLPIFVASIPQFVMSGIIIVGLIVLAFMLGRHDGAQSDTQTAPAVRTVGGSMFVLGSGFMIIAAIIHSTIPAMINVPGLLLLLIVGGGMLWQWSHRSGWSEWHEFAVAGGLLLVYAWFGFIQVPSVPGTSPTLDLIGNAVFASAAVALLFFIKHRLKASTS